MVDAINCKHTRAVRFYSMIQPSDEAGTEDIVGEIAHSILHDITMFSPTLFPSRERAGIERRGEHLEHDVGTGARGRRSLIGLRSAYFRVT